jgi:hypothetical protein
VSAPDPRESAPEDKPPTLWQTIASVNAAFFGVQSSKNRERDFKRGKPLHFVIVGLVMTAVFALVVWIAVKLVLHNAGL